MISTYLTPVLFPQQDYQYYNNKGYVIHTLCIPHIAQHRTRHVVKVCVPEPAHSAPLCDLRIMKVPVTWHQPKQVTPYVSTTWVSLAPCSQPPPLTTSLLCVFLPTLCETKPSCSNSVTTFTRSSYTVILADVFWNFISSV